MPTFDYLSHHHWLIYDETHNPDAQTKDTAMALQDSFIRYLPRQNRPLNTATGATTTTSQTLASSPAALEEVTAKPAALLHFYPSARDTILLGAKDKLLANFTAGVAYLIDQGYSVSLRPHGGLAVVNDAGVLNIALVSDNNHYPLTIDEAYEQIVKLIRLTLAPYHLTVEAYEIADSYCPGTFDLVVDGRKIGGIAQRRFKSGLTTAAYISVNGDQSARAALIKNFYEIGQADDRFPSVNPASMISLTDVLPEADAKELTVSRFKQAILDTIAQFSDYTPGDYLDPELQAIYRPRLEQANKQSLSIQPQNNL